MFLDQARTACFHRAAVIQPVLTNFLQLLGFTLTHEVYIIWFMMCLWWISYDLWCVYDGYDVFYDVWCVLWSILYFYDAILWSYDVLYDVFYDLVIHLWCVLWWIWCFLWSCDPFMMWFMMDMMCFMIHFIFLWCRLGIWSVHVMIPIIWGRCVLSMAPPANYSMEPYNTQKQQQIRYDIYMMYMIHFMIFYDVMMRLWCFYDVMMCLWSILWYFVMCFIFFISDMSRDHKYNRKGSSVYQRSRRIHAHSLPAAHASTHIQYTTPIPSVRSMYVIIITHHMDHKTHHKT